MPSELNDNNYSYKFTNDLPKIAVVTSRYHNEISYELDKQVINVMNSSGIAYDIFEVSGVLELPIALKLAINSSRYDGYVILGSITIDANTKLLFVGSVDPGDTFVVAETVNFYDDGGSTTYSEDLTSDA